MEHALGALGFDIMPEHLAIVSLNDHQVFHPFEQSSFDNTLTVEFGDSLRAASH